MFSSCDGNGDGGMLLAGKYGAIVSVGGGKPKIPVNDIKGFFDYNTLKQLVHLLLPEQLHVSLAVMEERARSVVLDCFTVLILK